MYLLKYFLEATQISETMNFIMAGYFFGGRVVLLEDTLPIHLGPWNASNNEQAIGTWIAL